MVCEDQLEKMKLSALMKGRSREDLVVSCRNFRFVLIKGFHNSHFAAGYYLPPLAKLGKLNQSFRGIDIGLHVRENVTSF